MVVDFALCAGGGAAVLLAARRRVGAAVGALAIVVLPYTGSLCETIIGRIPVPAAIRDRLRHLAAQIITGLRAFHDARRLAGFVLLTLAIWALDAAGAMIGARALNLN